MKKFTLIFLFIVCKVGLAQSFVLKGKDTVNLVDDQGKRQGKWVLTGKLLNLPEYAPDATVEEGKYMNSLKVGIWKHYFPNGNLQNKLTFENNRPNGFAIMYHENGKISEEGNWKNNRWVGPYKLYHENGNVQQAFNFNESGKREGKQQYYDEDGKVMIEGDWKEGREDGVITEYWPDGSLKAKKTFNGGNLDTDPAKTQMFEQKNTSVVAKKDAPMATPKEAAVSVKADEKIEGGSTALVNKPPVDLKTITGSGITIYNKNRQKSKSGDFVNGKLINGKVYIYTDNGILTRVALFEAGVYKGDSPLED